MTRKSKLPGDSLWSIGGLIPGSARSSAFALGGADPSPIPVLIAVPHAGREYPASLLARMRSPEFAALRLEDRYVDRLASQVAAATGAMLLVAHAPRAMIDLNRAPDDVDWEMFSGHAGSDGGEHLSGRRSRSGLGVIPRRLPGLGELWTRRHDRAELEARITGIHEPYHTVLAQTLETLRQRWGATLLIDLHSMPTLPARIGTAPPQFVLGDLFGASCDGSIVAASFDYFAENERRIAHNRPYAGGYVLQRHGRPTKAVHALQLEVDRACYLDADAEETGPGFDATARLLAGFVTRLAAVTAALATDRESGWAQAAE